MEINLNIERIKKAGLKFEEYLILNLIFYKQDLYIDDESTIKILENLELKGFIRLIDDDYIIDQKTRNFLAPKYTEETKEILDYLHQLRKKHEISNRPSKASVWASKITPRLAEGNDIEDIKAMIDMKFDKWINTEYEMYLRPSTLFNKTKFYNYMDELDQEEARKNRKSDLYEIMKDDD